MLVKEWQSVNIIVTDNPIAQAIERVCDKRYLRGAKCKNIISYLDGLTNGVWKDNGPIRRDIYKLKAYWIARLG